MKIITTHTGLLKVNTYILHDDKTAAVIDIGGNVKRVMETIDAAGLKVTHILLTHGHFDHIGGVAAMKQLTDAKICISAEDAGMLESDVLSLATDFGTSYPPVSPDILLKDGDIVDLGFAQLQVIATPGHTRGGLSYYDGNTVFSGDTLFNGSIGRTDFPGGDYDTLISSIKEKLFCYPDSTPVLPGHEESTTIGEEKRNNPFLGFGWDRR